MMVPVVMLEVVSPTMPPPLLLLLVAGTTMPLLPQLLLVVGTTRLPPLLVARRPGTTATGKYALECCSPVGLRSLPASENAVWRVVLRTKNGTGAC